MKCTIVAASLMVGLAIAYRGDGQNQNQHEAKSERQDSALRWQFDTHG